MKITAHSRTVPSVERLLIAEIISALESSYWRVRHFVEIDSTQSALVKAVKGGQAHAGEVFIAEFQSAGRGRADRTFLSAPGDGLLLSAAITPESQPQNRWGWLPLLAGVAASAAIFQSTGVQALLKWPNDLMIGAEKVGGIIAEKVDDVVVVGVGINCLQQRENLPAPGSTSLLLHSEEGVNRNLLAAAFLNSFKQILGEWQHNPAPIENRYRQLSSTLEREVRITLPDGVELVGRAAAISASGSLILADGREFVAADVTHIRPGK